LFISRLNVPVPVFASFAVGVSNNPDPIPAMRGVEGASWNNKRPAGVALAFQVRKHLVEAQVDVSSNILKNAPSGFSRGGRKLSYKSHNLRPEMAVIFLASALPGKGKRLA